MFAEYDEAPKIYPRKRFDEADSPMKGIVSSFRLLELLKAPKPIFVTLSGISTDKSKGLFAKVYGDTLVNELSLSKLTATSLSHDSKA